MNPENRKEYNRMYYNTNREKILLLRAEYRKSHEEEIKYRRNRYQTIHKDEIKARNEEYNLKHAERIKAYKDERNRIKREIRAERKLKAELDLIAYRQGKAERNEAFLKKWRRESKDRVAERDRLQSPPVTKTHPA